MDAITRCCREAYLQPFDRQKVIYLCGAIGGVFLVVVVILTISLMPSSSSDTPTVVVKGSDALKSAPLVVGYNNLPQNIKRLTKNQMSSYNFTGDWKQDKYFMNCTTCQTDYTKLKTGKVAVQLWAVNIDCAAEYKDAVSQTIEQIDVIKRLISLNSGSLLSVQNQTEIKTGFTTSPSTVSSIISINGGHSIDSRLGVLRMYYQLGVRVMALASSCNTPWAIYYGGSNSSTPDTGLSAFGEKVVLEMNRLGIVIDLTGSSLQTQIEVLNATKAPVIFSHSAAAGQFSDSNLMNVADDVLTKLKTNNGLFMVTFSPNAFSADGKNTSMVNVAEHINYVKNKIGAEYVGIGGGYDVETEYPSGLTDISTIGTLFDYLYTNSSWTLAQLEGLAGNNFLTVLSKVEAVKDELANSTTVVETLEPLDEFKTSNANQSCYTDFSMRYITTA